MAVVVVALVVLEHQEVEPRDMVLAVQELQTQLLAHLLPMPLVVGLMVEEVARQTRVMVGKVRITQTQVQAALA
jgi:hypothetical protein